MTLSALDILCGYKPESSIFQALTHYVIIAKYHIFLSWLNKTSPSFEIFSLLLNEKILCEHTIAFKNNTLRKFRAKWGTVYVHELRQISLSQGICRSYSFCFPFFNFYFGVRDTSIVNIESNSSIVTSVSSVGSVSSNISKTSASVSSGFQTRENS